MEVVEKLGHWVKWSVPVEHILVCWQKMLLLVRVPHLILKSIFWLRMRESFWVIVLEENFWKKSKVSSELTEAKKKKYWRKYKASVTHYFISDQEYPKKDRATIRGAANQRLLLKKTDCKLLKNSYMDESACLWKQLKWNKFPFMVTDCLEKFITGIDVARQRVWGNHLGGTKSLMRWQVVWGNYSKQITEKQNSVKTCTKSPKNETPPIYVNRCSFDQKRKSCPYKICQLISYKNSNLLLWNFIL